MNAPVSFPQGATQYGANLTQLAPAWVAEPAARGTWSILYSCIFTLTLCVWTAVHINIPPHGEPQSKQFWRKTKWTIIAIFAPELVLYTAWHQHLVAKAFCEDMYKLRLEQEGLEYCPNAPWWQPFWKLILRALPKSPYRGQESGVKTEDIFPGSHGSVRSSRQNRRSTPPKFSLTYGFYVVMGGITVNVSDIYDQVTWITVTPAGVLELAKRTSWRVFFEEDSTIQDKSKANYFAKGLVIIQVTYTVFLCISRKYLALPLTILEIHTLVHAACAMVMYGFWFNKPLDIRDAKKIETDPIRDDLALALMRSECSAYAPYTTRRRSSKSWLVWILDTFETPETDHTEAQFLLFDTDRIDAALENSDSSELALHEIRHPELQAPEIQTVQDTPMLPQDDGRVDRFLTYLWELFHTDHLRSHRESIRPALCLTPMRGIQISRDLVTGQVLSSGVGPAAYLSTVDFLSYQRHQSVFPKQIFSRLRSELAPKFFSSQLVSDSLKAVIPLPNINFRGAPVLYHSMAFHLSSKDVLRWHRAGRAFARTFTATSLSEEANVVNGRNGAAQRLPSLQSRDREPTRDFTLRLTNLHNGEPTTMGFSSGLALIVVGGLYSGVHIALWTYRFPTRTEEILWKISCCTLGLPPALLASFLILAAAWVAIVNFYSTIKDSQILAPLQQSLRVFSSSFNEFIERPCAIGWIKYTGMALFLVSMWPVNIVYGTAFFAMWAGVPLYIFARVYIIVEAFMSLRYVPWGVYQGITWAEYIPHL